jgi:hypothetical protein
MNRISIVRREKCRTRNGRFNYTRGMRGTVGAGTLDGAVGFAGAVFEDRLQ